MWCTKSKNIVILKMESQTKFNLTSSIYKTPETQSSVVDQFLVWPLSEFPLESRLLLIMLLTMSPNVQGSFVQVHTADCSDATWHWNSPSFNIYKKSLLSESRWPSKENSKLHSDRWEKFIFSLLDFASIVFVVTCLGLFSEGNHSRQFL